jgi:hypothetical protein
MIYLGFEGFAGRLPIGFDVLESAEDRALSMQADIRGAQDEAVPVFARPEDQLIAWLQAVYGLLQRGAGIDSVLGRWRTERDKETEAPQVSLVRPEDRERGLRKMHGRTNWPPYSSRASRRFWHGGMSVL